MIVARNLRLADRFTCPALDFQPGTMTALVGPNGGGKTSLLRALAGVEGSQGSLTIDGEDRDALPPALRMRRLAFVPASRDIAWPIAVRDLVALGLPDPDPAAVDGLLARFELEELATRPANRLSTGERARALIARALAASPRLLLLDEPLGNLDPYWVLRLADLLRAEADRGAAVVVALHDMAQLHRFDRALLVADGRLLMDEAPADLLADERFLVTFRLDRSAEGSFSIRQPAGPRSLP